MECQTTSVFLPWELHEQTVWKLKRYDTKRWTPRSVGAPGEDWRKNSRNYEETEPKWKQCPVVDVTGDGSKVRCCEEQYCIGTWNVQSMNQGKLEVVKQEMARLNIDILGISDLKWTGMGEFNSDDHYIYYCGQGSLRRNGVALTVNKRVWNAVVGCNLTNHWMISVPFQGKPFNRTVIQVYYEMKCLLLYSLPVNKPFPDANIWALVKQSHLFGSH